jgi:hypothetical protein
MVPHAEYVDVADAAHMIAGDRNDVFTDAVLAVPRPLTAPLFAVRVTLLSGRVNRSVTQTGRDGTADRSVVLT